MARTVEEIEADVLNLSEADRARVFESLLLSFQVPEEVSCSKDEVLRHFDEVRAQIRERTAGFSEKEIAGDVARARAELPD